MSLDESRQPNNAEQKQRDSDLEFNADMLFWRRDDDPYARRPFLAGNGDQTQPSFFRSIFAKFEPVDLCRGSRERAIYIHAVSSRKNGCAIKNDGCPAHFQWDIRRFYL